MNKQKLIEKIKQISFGEGDHGATRNDYESEYALIDHVLEIIDDLDEPQKVKVPPVVFKFLNDEKEMSKQERLSYLIRSKDGDQFYLTEMLPCDGIITDSEGDELFSWVEK